jgi:cysteine synthase A
LLCDAGERYRDTYFNDDWLAVQKLDPAPAEAAIEAFFKTGRFQSVFSVAGMKKRC